MRRKEREITDILEIESIIHQSDVCRIAFADSNIPYIVTMNFGYSNEQGRKLWFHCAGEGRKLEMMRKNSYVCFEIDTDHEISAGIKACDFGMKFSSVVGFGFISEVKTTGEKIYGLNRIMHHYTGRKEFAYKPDTFDRTTVLCLDINEMTSKKC